MVYTCTGIANKHIKSQIQVSQSEILKLLPYISKQILQINLKKLHQKEIQYIYDLLYKTLIITLNGVEQTGLNSLCQSLSIKISEIELDYKLQPQEDDYQQLSQLIINKIQYIAQNCLQYLTINEVKQNRLYGLKIEEIIQNKESYFTYLQLSCVLLMNLNQDSIKQQINGIIICLSLALRSNNYSLIQYVVKIIENKKLGYTIQNVENKFLSEIFIQAIDWLHKEVIEEETSIYNRQQKLILQSSKIIQQTQEQQQKQFSQYITMIQQQNVQFQRDFIIANDQGIQGLDLIQIQDDDYQYIQIPQYHDQLLDINHTLKPIYIKLIEQFAWPQLLNYQIQYELSENLNNKVLEENEIIYKKKKQDAKYIGQQEFEIYKFGISNEDCLYGLYLSLLHERNQQVIDQIKEQCKQLQQQQLNDELITMLFLCFTIIDVKQKTNLSQQFIEQQKLNIDSLYISSNNQIFIDLWQKQLLNYKEVQEILFAKFQILSDDDLKFQFEQNEINCDSQVNYIQEQLDNTDIWSNLNKDISSDLYSTYICYLYNNYSMNADIEDISIYLHNIKFQSQEQSKQYEQSYFKLLKDLIQKCQTLKELFDQISIQTINIVQNILTESHQIQIQNLINKLFRVDKDIIKNTQLVDLQQQQQDISNIQYLYYQYLSNTVNYDYMYIQKNIKNIIQVIHNILFDQFITQTKTSQYMQHVIKCICRYLITSEQLDQLNTPVLLLIIYQIDMQQDQLEIFAQHMFTHYRKSNETKLIIQNMHEMEDIEKQNIYNQSLITENILRDNLILGKLYININQFDKQQNKIGQFIFNSLQNSLIQLINLANAVADLSIYLQTYIFDDKNRLKMVTERIDVIPQQKSNIKLLIQQAEYKICQSYDKAVQALKLIESLVKNQIIIPQKTHLFILQCYHYFSLISQINTVDYMFSGLKNIELCNKLNNLIEQFVNGTILLVNIQNENYQILQIDLLSQESQDNKLPEIIKEFFNRKDTILLYQEYYKVLSSFETLKGIKIDSLFALEQTIEPKLKNIVLVNKSYQQLIIKLYNSHLQQKEYIGQLFQVIQKKYNHQQQVLQIYKQQFKIDNELQYDFVIVLNFASYLTYSQNKQLSQQQTIEIISQKLLELSDNQQDLNPLLKLAVRLSYYAQIQLFVNAFNIYYKKINPLFNKKQIQPKIQIQIQQTLMSLIFYIQPDKADIITNILLKVKLQQFDYTFIKQVLTQMQPLVINVLYSLHKYNLSSKLLRSDFICPQPGLSVPILLQPQINKILPQVHQLCYNIFVQGEIVLASESFDINTMLQNVMQTIQSVNQSQLETKNIIKKFVYKNLFDKNKSENLMQDLQKLKEKSNADIQSFYKEYFCWLIQCKQKLRQILIKQYENSTNQQIVDKINKIKANQSRLKDTQSKREETQLQYQNQTNQIQRQQMIQTIQQLQETINKTFQIIKTSENELMQTLFNPLNQESKAEKLVSQQLADYYVINENEVQLLMNTFYQITSTSKIMNNDTINKQILQLKLKDGDIIYTNINNGIIYQDISEQQGYIDDSKPYFNQNIYPSNVRANKYYSPLFDATLECLNYLLKQVGQKQNNTVEQNKIKDQIKYQYKHTFNQAINYYIEQGTNESQHNFINDEQPQLFKNLIDYYWNLLEHTAQQQKIENKFTNMLKQNNFDQIDYDLIMLREEQMKRKLQQPQMSSLIKQQIDKLEQIRFQINILINKYGQKWQQYVQISQEQSNQSVRNEMCKKSVQQILALTGFAESVTSGFKQYANIDIAGDQQSYVYLLNKIIESAGIYAYMNPQQYGELLLKQIVFTRKFGSRFIDSRQSAQQQNVSMNSTNSQSYKTLKNVQQNTQPYALILTDPCISAPLYEQKLKVNQLAPYVIQLLQVAVQSYTTTASAPGLDYYFFSQDGQIPELSLIKINEVVQNYNQTLQNLIQTDTILKTQQITQLLNSECALMHWKIRDISVFIIFMILQQKYDVSEKLIKFSMNKLICGTWENSEIRMMYCVNRGFNHLMKLYDKQTMKIQVKDDDIHSFIQDMDKFIDQLEAQDQQEYLTLQSIKMAFVTNLLYQYQKSSGQSQINNIFQQSILNIVEQIFEKYRDPQLALNVLPRLQPTQDIEDKLNTLVGNFDKVKQRDNFNGILIRQALDEMLIQKQTQEN